MELIELTDKAVEYLATAMKDSELPVKGIRFMVAGQGCMGYAYNAVLETGDPTETDFIINTYSVPVFIDPMSAPYLRGTTVDFVVTGFASGLKFKNNNNKSCGCGASFSPGE